MAGDRATGRTFRVLCKALLAASEGKNVLIKCEHNRQVEHVFRRAMDMTANSGLARPQRGAVLDFPNGGKLTIAAPKESHPDRFRGVKFGLELWDDVDG